jgi:hypothetical protein
VVIAVRSGTLGRSEACNRYMLSEEELSQLEQAFGRDGIAGPFCPALGRKRVEALARGRRGETECPNVQPALPEAGRFAHAA